MYKNEKIFQFFANLILALLTICCVAPFLLMISASFSSESALSVYGYTFGRKSLIFLHTNIYFPALVHC